MKPKLTGTPLPPPIRHEYKFSWFRKLRFKERLKILLGYNVQVNVHFLTQHSAGHCQPVIGATMTKELTPESQFLTDNMEVIKDLNTRTP